MRVTLLAHTPDPERAIALAARVCYSKEPPQDIAPEKARKLIRELFARGHESVLEHAFFSFLLEGISRVTSHQLVRHRLASYAQQSQRYVDLGEASFVCPPSIAEHPRAKIVFDGVMAHAREAYEELCRLGVAKEDARYVFPQAVATNIVVSLNARELLHIARVRLCRRAQWEVREVVLRMIAEVGKVAPVLTEIAGPPCKFGPCPEGEKGCGRPWENP
jgi:thymidylate synthase (FAD)|uniref:Flavin-dependent thymidylate synthase n=1 Tax=Candidatus Caldatribacterium californiense TaxID=1454726 RepID=A0A7V4DDS5_9BACT